MSKALVVFYSRKGENHMPGGIQFLEKGHTAYAAEFIRDAVDFFAEWKSHDTTEKFLTPALESVVRATVRDSEERVARLLFKNAVELHLLTRLIYHDFNYKPEEVQAIRADAIQLVKETNGSVNLDYID